MLMPIAYVAAAEGIAKLQDSKVAFWRGYAKHGAAVVLTFAVAISNQLPLWQLTKPATWEFTGPRQQAAAALIDRVPGGGAVVESDSSLMNHLVDHHDVYFIGQQGNPPGRLPGDRQRQRRLEHPGERGGGVRRHHPSRDPLGDHL